MTYIAVYSGFEQPDVAFLEHEGVSYRCYTYQVCNTDGDGIRIEAMCFVEQPHGQDVLLFHNTVRTPAGGEYTDCPRIVPRGTSFVVHWIEHDGVRDGSGRDLHRADIDLLASPYSWTHRGSVTLHDTQLYDVYSPDSGSDYLLARMTSATAFSITRVNGNDWIDTAWVVSLTPAAAPDHHCLGCWADTNGSVDAAIVFYQRSATTALYGYRVNWSDGLGAAGPSALTTGLGDWCCAAAAKTRTLTDATCIVVGEWVAQGLPLGTEATYMHNVLHVEINTSTLAVLGDECTTPNLTMMSKPWSYASGDSTVTPDLDVFCGVGFKAVESENDWAQSNVYVVRFDQSKFGVGPDIARPVLAGVWNQAIFDTQILAKSLASTDSAVLGSGPRRRINHVSHASGAPSSGPLLKSRTFAVNMFGRIEGFEDGDTQLQPMGSTIKGLRYTMEDAWLHHRDATDPAQPSANVKTAYPQSAGEHVAAGAGVVIGGGVSSVYDGRKVVELGFAWTPEIFNFSSPAGSIPSGIYTYVVVAEWRDAKGQVHRSEPSIPVTVSHTGPARIGFDIRCINLSLKDHEAYDTKRSQIVLNVFRTTDDGVLFYNVFRSDTTTGHGAEDAPVNDPAASVVSVTDNVTDAVLNLGHLLPYTYSSGAWSPLPPGPVPAFTVLASWQNRIWGPSSEDPGVLWYSLEILPEQGGEQYSVPEFNIANTFRVDGIGTITAMQEVDNALVIFTRDGIFALTGVPNDGNGEGARLSMQTLHRGIGCMGPRSVAVARPGVFFQSEKGYYLLTHAYELQYVGAPVEDDIRAAGNIRAATLMEEHHQIRLAINESVAGGPAVLVYDYLMELWAKSDLPLLSSSNWLSATQDAASWRGHDGEHAHVVLAQGGLGIEKPEAAADAYVDESALDSTVAIPVDVRTDWIKLGGIAGFKRIKRIGIQLTKPTDSEVRVQVEYDTDGTFTDGANLQDVTIASPASDYIQINCDVQKCSAIRVRIFENTGVAQTDTIRIHAMTLVVGRKPGLRRVPVGQVAT